MFRLAIFMGLVGFLVGCLLGVASNDPPLPFGIGVGGITFAASLFLMIRDLWQEKQLFRSMRNAVVGPQIRDEEFAERFPEIERSVLLAIRQAVSEFFDAPEQAIDPICDLSTMDFFLGGRLYWFVISRVCPECDPKTEDRVVLHKPIVLGEGGDFGTFAEEVIRAIHNS